MDDTASLGEPLHGREGWHATFPGHAKPPNEAKEASIMQTKQPKRKKAKDENKIAQAESYMAKTQSNHTNIQIGNKSTDGSKNYKFKQGESKASVKNKGIKLEGEGGG